jgi:hypothetical protein
MVRLDYFKLKTESEQILEVTKKAVKLAIELNNVTAIRINEKNIKRIKIRKSDLFIGDFNLDIIYIFSLYS